MEIKVLGETVAVYRSALAEGQPSRYDTVCAER